MNSLYLFRKKPRYLLLSKNLKPGLKVGTKKLITRMRIYLWQTNSLISLKTTLTCTVEIYLPEPSLRPSGEKYQTSTNSFTVDVWLLGINCSACMEICERLIDGTSLLLMKQQWWSTKMVIYGSLTIPIVNFQFGQCVINLVKICSMKQVFKRRNDSFTLIFHCYTNNATRVNNLYLLFVGPVKCQFLRNFQSRHSLTGTGNELRCFW